MAASVGLPDSSVLIAGFIPEHPFHKQVALPLREIKQTGGLIAHTMAETYSVLTGQTYGHSPANVLRYLDQFLARPPLGLSPESYLEVLRKLADAEIVGGAIYDALIATTAAQAGLRLFSLDRRATRVYELCGVDVQLLGDV